jgi:hypothetical protein
MLPWVARIKRAMTVFGLEGNAELSWWPASAGHDITI